MTNLEKMQAALEKHSRQRLGRIMLEMPKVRERNISFSSSNLGFREHYYKKVCESVTDRAKLIYLVPQIVNWYREQRENGLFETDILSATRTRETVGEKVDIYSLWLGVPGIITPNGASLVDGLFTAIAPADVIDLAVKATPLHYMAKPKFIAFGTELFTQEKIRVYDYNGDYVIRTPEQGSRDSWGEPIFEG